MLTTSARVRPVSVATLFVSLVLLPLFSGCREGSSPTPPASLPPLQIRLDSPPMTSGDLSANDPFPTLRFAFQGAPGHVKLILEVAGTSADSANAPFLYETLFRAEGSGTFAIDIQANPPDAADPTEGRVTLTCESAGERSSARYNPRLWFGTGFPNARITQTLAFASDFRTVPDPLSVELARIEAKSSDPTKPPIRLLWKARFSSSPTAPQLKAKAKPRPKTATKP